MYNQNDPGDMMRHHIDSITAMNFGGNINAGRIINELRGRIGTLEATVKDLVERLSAREAKGNDS